jgi:hypothetical protein
MEQGAEASGQAMTASGISGLGSALSSVASLGGDGSKPSVNSMEKDAYGLAELNAENAKPLKYAWE